jgi:hypothetical protein
MRNISVIVLFCTLVISGFSLAKSAVEEPTVIACAFEKLPVMIMVVRSGMGAANNTLQIGQTQPVSLQMGSSLSTATHGTKEYVFSLRPPASVTVNGTEDGSKTHDGECISTAQP